MAAGGTTETVRVLLLPKLNFARKAKSERKENAGMLSHFKFF